jgi:ATP/maltotriose-dependent transcriptional regulator MalT
MLFILILLGFHIIPVLFLNIYLQKYYVAEAALEVIQDKMEENKKKYDISRREAEVIELICKGMSNQEISDSLFISLQTVKDHVHRIFIKTGVKNRIQLSNLFGK